MPPLIIDGKQHPDRWHHIADHHDLVDRDFSVSIGRWSAERDLIWSHTQRLGLSLGVRLESDSDPLQLKADIECFELIVIHITAATDGRCFSIAARLREHLNYRHQLRVSGDIAADQLLFMQRCGINAFELSGAVNATHFEPRYRRFYQSGGPYSTPEDLINRSRRQPPT